MSAIPAQQMQINSQFAEDMTRLKLDMDGLREAVEQQGRVIALLVERLGEQELVVGDEFTAFLDAFFARAKQAQKRAALAKRGGVKCPGCGAVLKNVEGVKGDRCDWCGHTF